MKLKKIVSLALAGVLAVSMLTACGDNGSSSSSSSEETTTTGYSAMLAKELDELDDEDYISFKDSADDQTALKVMLAGVANNTLGTKAKGSTATAIQSSDSGFEDAIDNLISKAKLDEYMDSSDKAVPTTALKNADTKNGILYVADGSISMEQTMKTIAADLKANHGFTTTDLVADDKDTQAEIGFEYDYVVSVSVVNVANTTDLNSSFSANVVLVTVARTVTNG